jgi:RNA recognition motif-containing protein
MKDMFRPLGLNPTHADILSEPGSGRSKGCGIVRFATREEAEKAVQQMNGTTISGRTITVRIDKFAA